jgi:hypothetical protein
LLRLHSHYFSRIFDILLPFIRYSPIGKIAEIVKIMEEIEMKNAVEKLLSEIGKIKWENDLDAFNTDSHFDSIVNLAIGNKKKKLFIEFKSNGEPRTIAEYAGWLGNRSRDEFYPIIVAPFISERGMELCKKSDIGCIDLSGNAYIKFDNVLINLWGNENRYRLQRKQKNLFSQRSYWVIRCMLNDPKKEWTMQELSNNSFVSLAQVYKVLDSLESENYVDKKRAAIKLSDPSGLLDRLRNYYKYDDQKIVGYYSPFKSYSQIFPKLREIPECNYAVTLGAAAQLVLPVVRSTDVYVYVDKIEPMKDTLELESVEFGGNVYLITPNDDGIIRSAQTIDGVKVVSNLQLYLDLYNYPQRGREQAEAIREKILDV